MIKHPSQVSLVTIHQRKFLDKKEYIAHKKPSNLETYTYHWIAVIKHVVTPNLVTFSYFNSLGITGKQSLTKVIVSSFSPRLWATCRLISLEITTIKLIKGLVIVSFRLRTCTHSRSIRAVPRNGKIYSSLTSTWMKPLYLPYLLRVSVLRLEKHSVISCSEIHCFKC